MTSDDIQNVFDDAYKKHLEDPEGTKEMRVKIAFSKEASVLCQAIDTQGIPVRFIGSFQECFIKTKDSV